MYNGIELRIVEREEAYMHAVDRVTVTRVIAPNGGVVPININHRESLKSIADKAIKALDTFKEMNRGDVEHELTKPLKP